MSEAHVTAVSTVVPSTVPAGQQLITARRKGTKDQPLPDGQKVRAIVVPEFDLSALPSKMIIFVSNSLAQVASQKLAVLWTGQEDGLKEVRLADFTVDSLLSFAAAAAESKRLSGDTIEAATAEFVSAAIAPKGQKRVREILRSLAAPAKIGSLAETARILEIASGFSASEEDEVIFEQVTRKLEARKAELEAMLEGDADF